MARFWARDSSSFLQTAFTSSLSVLSHHSPSTVIQLDHRIWEDLLWVHSSSGSRRASRDGSPAAAFDSPVSDLPERTLVPRPHDRSRWRRQPYSPQTIISHRAWSIASKPRCRRSLGYISKSGHQETARATPHGLMERLPTVMDGAPL